MQTEYHQRIIDYYTATENAYKDSWDLNNSLAIHYGYWDKDVNSFPESLSRMNEIMKDAAKINRDDTVLDAGCGVGGSSIWLAQNIGCKVTGITLSARQAEQAKLHAREKGVEHLAEFREMNYAETDFLDASFDVVWGCESVCYADDKNKFISEAFRLLKPGGRLVVADGFVTKFTHNDRPVIRKWLEGWQVNHLVSPGRFSNQMQLEGFQDVNYRDISRYVMHSSRRLLKFYFLATGWLMWKSITFSNNSTPMQRKNIKACWHQYWGLRANLWQYGLITGQKPE